MLIEVTKYTASCKLFAVNGYQAYTICLKPIVQVDSNSYAPDISTHLL